MITPPFLKSGDTVAIVAPGRKVSPAEMEPAIRQLRSWGLKVITGPHLFGQQDQYSGKDEERAADLQLMLDDETVRAIICARGGYGTVRIVDRLDFGLFSKNPKWIVGYSDITVLHSHVNRQTGVETLHATMPINFPADGSENESTQSLHEALCGKVPEYETGPYPLNRIGKAKGILTGGNLSILYALNGTPSDMNTDGKILFIEDLDEYLYHIDRMMMTLKRSGKLNNLAGMIVGGMSKMNDNTVPFGKTAEEIIAETVSGYGFPLCFGFPAGHLEQNMSLIMGRNISMDVQPHKVTLAFDRETKENLCCA